MCLFFLMIIINILDFQEDKIEHIIYKIDLLTPNRKFLSKLRHKK